MMRSYPQHRRWHKGCGQPVSRFEYVIPDTGQRRPVYFRAEVAFDHDLEWDGDPLRREIVRCPACGRELREGELINVPMEGL